MEFLDGLPLAATRDNRANMKLTSRNEQWTFQ